MKTFFLHEDDWGMVSLLPAENYASSQEIVQEARKFSAAHFDGTGWTDVYVLPREKVAISARNIPFEELNLLFTKNFRPPEEFLTGYSSQWEPVTNGFAFLDEYHSGFYGTQKAGLVTQLNYLGSFSEDPEVIARYISILTTLGTKYNLILADWWQDNIVNLQDPAALDEYFRDEDE